jgi:hypothetical protein
MIFRNLINKLKKETKPKKMNLGVRIVELARELNCLYVNERNQIGITSGIIYFSNNPYIPTKSLMFNVMKSFYAVIGYVENEKQYKLIFKNFYRCPEEKMTTERYFTDYEEFKQEYIKCLNDYHKYLEDYYLNEIEQDFK